MCGGQYFADASARLDTFIDIHAHTTGYGAFMYCNSVADRARVRARAGCARVAPPWFVVALDALLPPHLQLQSESLIPKLLHARCPDFSFQRTRFDQDSSKAGTGRRAVGALLAPQVSCYTLEVSFYAATTAAAGSGRTSHEVYTQDMCTWPSRGCRWQQVLPPNHTRPTDAFRSCVCVCVCVCVCGHADIRLGRDVALTFLDYHDVRTGSAKPRATHHRTASGRSSRSGGSASTASGAGSKAGGKASSSRRSRASS